jgi:hypothetical protein
VLVLSFDVKHLSRAGFWGHTERDKRECVLEHDRTFFLSARAFVVVAFFVLSSR